MLEGIRAFFQRSMAPAPTTGEPREPDIRMAACALLLELAHADEEFGEEERAHLRSAIQRHYGLDPDGAEELIRLAEEERRQAVDLWQFTRLINEHYSAGQKMVLAEVMWGLVYADGALAAREDTLIRRITDLLDLKPGYLADVRRRAREGGRTGG